MARSRNIKPGFFMNEELADIEPFGRLLFIGLWTLADREGRMENRPKKIKAEVFPYDSVEIEPLLDSLEEKNFILRYEFNGNKYIQVNNFLKHQKPHIKETASVIPAPQGQAPTKVVPRQGQAPTKVVPSTYLESLIPDSLNLIPDSLIPDSLIPDTRINIVDVVDSYNSTCKSLPHVQQVTDKRKKSIKARLATFGIEQLQQAFCLAEKSDFLSGRDGKWTSCSFDWLMNETNLVKVLEGTYENKDPAAVPMARGKPTNAIDDFFRRDDCEHRRPESRPTNGCRNLTALTGGVS